MAERHSSPDKLPRSRHGEARLNQRGIRQGDVELIGRCGTEVEDGVYLVCQQDAARQIARLKNEIGAIERIAGKKLVLREGRVVTAYPSGRRDTKRALRRARARGRGRPGRDS